MRVRLLNRLRGLIKLRSVREDCVCVVLRRGGTGGNGKLMVLWTLQTRAASASGEGDNEEAPVTVLGFRFFSEIHSPLITLRFGRKVNRRPPGVARSKSEPSWKSRAEPIGFQHGRRRALPNTKPAFCGSCRPFAWWLPFPPTPKPRHCNPVSCVTRNACTCVHIPVPRRDLVKLLLLVCPR